jgi:hypothetical protein
VGSKMNNPSVNWKLCVGQKSKNKPSEPENGFWAPKSVFIDRNFCKVELSETKNVKINSSEAKTGRVIYLSIGNFIRSKKKKYTFGGVNKVIISPQSPKQSLGSTDLLDF